jgi:hypothetical protein
MRHSPRPPRNICITSTKGTATTRSQRPSKNTTRTSHATCTKGRIIIESESGPLELRDVLVIETNDGQSLEFEVVGLVEDDEKNAYAVCYSEKADEFVVTDAVGTLLDDDELAQEILDDFFVLAEESGPADSEAEKGT